MKRKCFLLIPLLIVLLMPAFSTAETPQNTLRIRLYFRYMETAYLSGEERTLSIPLGDNTILTVVNALISGPNAQSPSLTPLFPEGTKALSVSQGEDGTLYITFSAELMNKYADEPDDRFNENERAEATLRRKLCMASLTDTLTEAGLCARVQVLVNRESDAITSLRLPANFYRDTEDETPLGPISRNEDVLLTPHNALIRLLSAWMNRRHETLAACVKQSDLTNLQTAYAAFDVAPVLTGFTVTAGVVSADGAHAVLCASLTIRTDGADREIESWPVALSMEDGTWKIAYSDLIALMKIK